MTKSKKAKGFDVDFIPVPYECVKDKDLNRTDEMIAGLVYLMTVKRQDNMFMSNKYIGDVIGAGAGTVANSISKLNKKGYVLCTYKDKLKRNRDRMTSGLRLTKVSLPDESKEEVSLPDEARIIGKNNVVSFPDEHKEIKNKISNKGAKKPESREVNIMIAVLKGLNPAGHETWYRNSTQRKSAAELFKVREQNIEKFDWLVSKTITLQGGEYFPSIGSPYDFQMKFTKVIAYFKRNNISYEKKSTVPSPIEEAAEELGYQLGD